MNLNVSLHESLAPNWRQEKSTNDRHMSLHESIGPRHRIKSPELTLHPSPRVRSNGALHLPVRGSMSSVLLNPSKASSSPRELQHYAALERVRARSAQACHVPRNVDVAVSDSMVSWMDISIISASNSDFFSVPPSSSPTSSVVAPEIDVQKDADERPDFHYDEDKWRAFYRTRGGGSEGFSWPTVPRKTLFDVEEADALSKETQTANVEKERHCGDTKLALRKPVERRIAIEPSRKHWTLPDAPTCATYHPRDAAISKNTPRVVLQPRPPLASRAEVATDVTPHVAVGAYTLPSSKSTRAACSLRSTANLREQRKVRPPPGPGEYINRMPAYSQMMMNKMLIQKDKLLAKRTSAADACAKREPIARDGPPTTEYVGPQRQRIGVAEQPFVRQFRALDSEDYSGYHIAATLHRTGVPPCVELELVPRVVRGLTVDCKEACVVLRVVDTHERIAILATGSNDAFFRRLSLPLGDPDKIETSDVKIIETQATWVKDAFGLRQLSSTLIVNVSFVVKKMEVLEEGERDFPTIDTLRDDVTRIISANTRPPPIPATSDVAQYATSKLVSMMQPKRGRPRFSETYMRSAAVRARKQHSIGTGLRRPARPASAGTCRPVPPRPPARPATAPAGGRWRRVRSPSAA